MTTSSSGDQILDAELAALLDDVGAARVAVLRLNRAQFVDDDADDQVLARENRAQPLDRLHELGQLVDDLLALEAGEPLQLHVENGLRLKQRQPELLDQSRARLGRML